VVNQQWPIYYRLGITKEELVQEGSLNLMRAAELFDPERGLRFSTYATIWTNVSNSHLTELVRLPQREKTAEQD
jgi:DNA-directed RNA polymerase sigma subunit (sigma70/sigma32)